VRWIFFKQATLDNLRRLKDQEWALKIIEFEHGFPRLNWVIVGWLVRYSEDRRIKNVYAIGGCIGTPALGVIDIVSRYAVNDIPIVIPEGLNQFFYVQGNVVFARTKRWVCCFDDFAVFELMIGTELMQYVRRFHKEYPTKRRHILSYIHAHLDVPRVIAIVVDLSEATPKVKLVDVMDLVRREAF
jgi:hypothetical protein